MQRLDSPRAACFLYYARSDRIALAYVPVADRRAPVYYLQCIDDIHGKWYSITSC